MGILFTLSQLRLIQIIIFGGLFAGVYYFTLYDDGGSVKKSIQTVEDNINKTSAELKKKEIDLVNVKKFEQETMNEEESVKQFLNFMPTSLTFTDVSTLVIREARSAGVNIELKQDRNLERQKDTEYRTLNINLKVSGAFSQILLFLSKLTNQKSILVVYDIDMKINKTTQLIETQLSISAYRYEKEKEKKKSRES